MPNEQRNYEINTDGMEYSHGRHILSDAIRGFVVGVRGALEGRKLKREVRDDRERRIAAESYRQRLLDFKDRELKLQEALAQHKMDQPAEKPDSVQMYEYFSNQIMTNPNLTDEQKRAELEKLRNASAGIEQAQPTADIQTLEWLTNYVDQMPIEDAEKEALKTDIVRGFGKAGEREPSELENVQAWIAHLQGLGIYSEDELTEIQRQAAEKQLGITPDALKTFQKENESLVRTMTTAKDADGNAIFMPEEIAQAQRKHHLKRFGLDMPEKTLTDEIDEVAKALEYIKDPAKREQVLQNAINAKLNIKPSTFDELSQAIDWIEKTKYLNEDEKESAINDLIANAVDPQELVRKKLESEAEKSTLGLTEADLPEPFLTAFRFVTRNGMTPDQIKQNLASLQGILQAAAAATGEARDTKMAAAREYVAGLAAAAADTTEVKSYVAREELIATTQHLREALQAIETGRIEGISEAAHRWLGTTRDSAVAEISTQLQLAIQRYRQLISGAAFTEAEAEEYKRIFPDIGKEAELNAAILNALEDVAIRNQKLYYRRYLGSTAATQFAEAGTFVGITDDTPREPVINIDNRESWTDAEKQKYDTLINQIKLAIRSGDDKNTILTVLKKRYSDRVAERLYSEAEALVGKK